VYNRKREDFLRVSAMKIKNPVFLQARPRSQAERSRESGFLKNILD
jgi:hypothetical protein